MKLSARMQGALITLFLVGCGAATVVGQGCRVYGEARAGIPWSDLENSPQAVVAWIDALDFAMTEACVKP